MKVLILGINFAPELVAMGNYTTGLAEYLSRAGDEVEVVTAPPYYPQWRIFDGYSATKYSSETMGYGIKVTRCPIYVPGNPTGIKRIIHYITFAISSLPIMVWKALTLRPDVVFVVAPSLVSAPNALLCAKLCGAKSWLHVQDFEVSAAYATGLLKQDSITGKFAEKFNRWIHKKFDIVSTISKPMIDHLKKMGVCQDKIYELRNWANLENVKVKDYGTSTFIKEFNITNKNIILYSGNIANKQGLDIIPQCASLLKDRPDVKFIVCGDGPYLETLKERSKDLSNINFYPLQPMNKLGELMALATVHFLPQIAGVSDSVLPSKLTNMLASGRPIVVTAEKGTALAQAVDSAGIAVPPGDALAAARAISFILDNEKEKFAMGRIARKRALEQWDSSEILYNFKDYCTKLAKQ